MTTQTGQLSRRARTRVLRTMVLVARDRTHGAAEQRHTKFHNHILTFKNSISILCADRPLKIFSLHSFVQRLRSEQKNKNYIAYEDNFLSSARKRK